MEEDLTTEEYPELPNTRQTPGVMKVLTDADVDAYCAMFSRSWSLEEARQQVFWNVFSDLDPLGSGAQPCVLCLGRHEAEWHPPVPAYTRYKNRPKPPPRETCTLGVPSRDGVYSVRWENEHRRALRAYFKLDFLLGNESDIYAHLEKIDEAQFFTQLLVTKSTRPHLLSAVQAAWGALSVPDMLDIEPAFTHSYYRTLHPTPENNPYKAERGTRCLICGEYFSSGGGAGSHVKTHDTYVRKYFTRARTS